MELPYNLRFAIIGGGNIGQAIARGLVESGRFSPSQITITRRRTDLLQTFAEQGFIVKSDNLDAVRNSDVIVISVLPHQLNAILKEVSSDIIPEKHVIISVVSGVSIDDITHLGKNLPVIRAMPTLAIKVRESITCIAGRNNEGRAIDLAKSIFDLMGETMIIDEELMTAATVLCGCGLAFFLRAIRAASQGGIEIGFHPSEALPLAAQTAKGVATLLLSLKNHPETEIDRVTTPKGCTIAGLNEMEHQGFSSAMIKGILTSAKKAEKLYDEERERDHKCE